MNFTQTIYNLDEVQSILWKTFEHPFNRELAEGSLDRKKFQFYLKQDSLYLIDFAKVLAQIAGSLDRPDQIEAFLEFAQGALIGERSLHQHFFELDGIRVDVDRAPGCFAYTQFLLATVQQKPAAVACAAVLPCFWVYREVGRNIFARSAEGNPYQKWIDTYASEEFDRLVARAGNLVDEIADAESAQRREEMLGVFIRSCRLEWMFWDSAYRLEDWEPKN